MKNSALATKFKNSWTMSVLLAGKTQYVGHIFILSARDCEEAGSLVCLPLGGLPRGSSSQVLISGAGSLSVVLESYGI